MFYLHLLAHKFEFRRKRAERYILDDGTVLVCFIISILLAAGV